MVPQDKVPIDSYASFVRHLEDREYFGQKLGLERIQTLLDRLGNPEKKFRSIHIAGTNGKGSTAAMIASILKEAGLKVGLYTSPHLTDFCERIRIGDRLIGPDEVMHLVRAIREVEEEPLTFFELATAIAFLYFAEKRVDPAVIETGLGGRLDATNVITPLVSVITTIGLDHTQHLGDTLEKIAFEKAGIIKSGVPVVVGALPAEAMEVVLSIVKAQRSFLPDLTRPFDKLRTTLSLLRRGEGRGLSLAGRHQQTNAAIALKVVEVLNEKKDVDIHAEAIRRGLANVRWPCRLETVQEKPWILLDGAHNPDAMRVVAEYLQENLKGRRLKVLFGAMADKDLDGILAEIVPIADEFVFTAPKLKRAASPGDLANLVQKWDMKNTVVEGVGEALKFAIDRLNLDEVLLVTGSLFVVGEARGRLQEAKGSPCM